VVDRRNRALQPGFHLVEVKKSIRLPDGMEAVPRSNWEEGLQHGGARKDKPAVNPCGGGMKTLLLNNGDTKHECTYCGKKWLLSSDDSKIRGVP